MNKVKELAEKHFAEAVALRREFHQYPEPSLQEERTSRRVKEELEKLGLKPYSAAGTGVVAVIEGKAAGKTIALRADMDALELVEENEIDYKSKKEGLMHACGHDAHTAGLLTAAKILTDLKDEFNGKVKLIFQPGEEVALGAKNMVADHVLTDVDAIFGIHVWNEVPAGKVALGDGPRMAAVSKFAIDVTGQGGHGSMPHQGIDAATTAAAIVMNLQTLVSREIDPLEAAVVTVGVFNSGSRFNVLPGKAHLEGTTRCFNAEINDKLPQMIKRVAEETARAYRAEVKVEYDKLTLVVNNNAALSKLGRQSASSLFGEDTIYDLEKTTGGEDFSFYTEEVPSTFAFVGAKNQAAVEYYPHHHPKFNIDETALKNSAALYAKFAVDYLNNN
jgi:amidohydrolase